MKSFCHLALRCLWSCTDSLLCWLVSACGTEVYFEALLKGEEKTQTKQNREKEKQRAQVSHVGTLMRVLFLERAGPLLIRGESAWYDKRSTHVASAWLRLSSRCQKEPHAICRYIIQPSSRELAEFWNLYLVLMFCTELASEIPALSEWQLELRSRNICPPKLLNSPTAKSVTELADRQGQQHAVGTVSRSFVPLVPILCGRTVCLPAKRGKATLAILGSFMSLLAATSKHLTCLNGWREDHAISLTESCGMRKGTGTFWQT